MKAVVQKDAQWESSQVTDGEATLRRLCQSLWEASRMHHAGVPLRGLRSNIGVDLLVLFFPGTAYNFAGYNGRASFFI